MECDRDADGMAIPRAVISLGRSLGLSIVAEGVEREEQFESLRRLEYLELAEMALPEAVIEARAEAAAQTAAAQKETPHA